MPDPLPDPAPQLPDDVLARRAALPKKPAPVVLAGARVELRPLDLIKFPAHQADEVEHITKLVGRFVGIHGEQQRIQHIDGVAGTRGEFEIATAQGADHATVLSFGVQEDGADATRKPAEDDRSRRVALSRPRLCEHHDVCIREAFFIKRIEDAETTGFPVVTPVVPGRIG